MVILDADAAILSAPRKPSSSSPTELKLQGLTYRVTASEAMRLKELCKSVGMRYVSTYDCCSEPSYVRELQATRHSVLESKQWWVSSIVDLHARNQLPAKDSGNGVDFVPKDPLSAADILGHDRRLLMASSSRRSSRSHDSLSACHRYIANGAKGLPDEMAIFRPPETTFAITSWHRVGAAN